MKRRFWVLVGILVLSLPEGVSAADLSMYQCPGPSDTLLFTDRERSGCHPMVLGSLTIAPARTDSESVAHTNYPRLRPFPMDWYSHTDPVGSMRNRMLRGIPYGMQNWIDYNAPVGSMRNSVGTWPNPFRLYGW